MALVGPSNEPPPHPEGRADAAEEPVMSIEPVSTSVVRAALARRDDAAVRPSGRQRTKPEASGELPLLAEADRVARAYVRTAPARRAYPDAQAVAALSGFDEPFPDQGRCASEGLHRLDRLGSPATANSIGSRYFGYVVGGVLPAAAAAERLAIAWDQRASSRDSSPAAAAIEQVAARWILDALDLPRESAVGFGTSATACTLACLSAARRVILAAQGWDVDAKGLAGAPLVRVVASAGIHVAVRKALRILGFGLDNVLFAPVDAFGRVDPARLPDIDGDTILCLQAGDVNTGEFDPFSEIVPSDAAPGFISMAPSACGHVVRARPNSATASSSPTAGRRTATNG
jgi:hypothetical protein